MKIVFTEIEKTQLKPNPDNPRTITPERLEQLKSSLMSFPDMLKARPLIVDVGMG